MNQLSWLLLASPFLVACDHRGDDTPLVRRGGGEVLVESASPAIGREGSLVEAVGLETLGGVFTPLLKLGSAIPCEAAEIFSTAADDQDQITLGLYRGEAKLVKDSHFLGRFKVTGFALAPRGEPQVEIHLVAREGDISILARDKMTGEPLRVERVE